MRDIRQVFESIIASCEGTLTFERLRGDVECYRNKPLLIEVDTMPLRMSGYVVPLRNVDLICIHPHLDDVIRRFTILHEEAHLLLDHVPRSTDASTPTYAEFVSDRDLRSAMYSQFGMFDEPIEEEAEALATLLFDHIIKEEHAMPLFSRRLFKPS